MVKVTYNDAVIASLEGGNIAMLQCAGKKMIDDIIVTAPEIENSPLPIEVATEEEMNALLETAEIGNIYKYTGETGTYENGALYVVEEEVNIISFTIASTSYQAEEGMTWGEWVDSEYNTESWITDGEYIYYTWGDNATFVSTDGTLSGRVTPNETIINGTTYDTRDAY